MRDARLDILLKAGECARRGQRLFGADAARQLAVIARDGAWLQAVTRARELRPLVGGDLVGEVAHAAGEATFLDRPNGPWRAVGNAEQKISPRPRARRSWKKTRTGIARGVPVPANNWSGMRLKAGPRAQAGRAGADRPRRSARG